MDTESNTPLVWAQFRFSIVGPLLSSPPPRGELEARIRRLAQTAWRDPIRGVERRFSVATITRWYYKALQAPQDPVGALRRAIRKDAGRTTVSPRIAAVLFDLYREYPHWTYQLHYDNLKAAVEADPTLGPLPSYATVRRFMKSQGLYRRKRLRPSRMPGRVEVVVRAESREVRSFEAEYVGSIWHLDFHHGSRKVLLPGGEWVRPIALGIVDDRSRAGVASDTGSRAEGPSLPAASLAPGVPPPVVSRGEGRGPRARILAGHPETRIASELAQEAIRPLPAEPAVWARDRPGWSTTIRAPR